MMACLDNSQVLKEGTVHKYENARFRGEKKKYFHAELQLTSSPIKALECYLYSSKDGKKGELKDKIEMTRAHQVTTSTHVIMEKHKYDSYICITPTSGLMTFLHFKTIQERDEWYKTIESTLRNLNIPTIAADDESAHHTRSRLHTESQQDLKQAVERRRNSPTNNRVAISEPVGNAQGFGNVLEEMKRKGTRKMQQIQPEECEEVNAEPQANFNPCCIRHHMVGYHADGKNMVFHPEAHYQNIHFVESEDDWHREIQAKQGNVKLHSELYDDFHKLTVIQTPEPNTTNEGPKWPKKQRKPSDNLPPEPEATCPVNHHTQHDDDGDAAAPTYENCARHNSNNPRRSRRIPVEDDERDHTGASSHRFQHPNPPSPPLPSREPTSPHSRRSSMRDRPLPPTPPKDDDVAKVKNNFERRPSNSYVSTPTRRHRQPPPLPLVTGNKLERSKRCLMDEMRQPNGVTKDLLKTEVAGEKIALEECNDSIIVAGWERTSNALTNALHIGDKLTMVNQQMLNSARFAQDTITMTGKEKVTLVVQRIPYGNLISIHKDHSGESLGIQLSGNEITDVYPNGLAALQGKLRLQTAGITNHGLLCNWAITEINTRPVGYNATTEQVQTMLRDAGDDVLLVLHPVDFIQVMREKLANTGDRYNFH